MKYALGAIFIFLPVGNGVGDSVGKSGVGDGLDVNGVDDPFVAVAVFVVVAVVVVELILALFDGFVETVEANEMSPMCLDLYMLLAVLLSTFSIAIMAFISFSFRNVGQFLSSEEWLLFKFFSVQLMHCRPFVHWFITSTSQCCDFPHEINVASGDWHVLMVCPRRRHFLQRIGNCI